MSKDDLYRYPKFPLSPFEFNAEVAQVFDDMLRRSIPFYDEIIRRQVQLIERLYQPETVIFDLGCSNGNLGIALTRQMASRPFRMVAVDNSAPMLEAFEQRLADSPGTHDITLRCEDICRTPIENASVVVLNFTLQFVPPEERDALTARIRAGLKPAGALLLCEKTSHSNSFISDLQNAFYYGFKRENGYSDLEISQKREALEKVLVAESLEKHLQRLGQAGFETMDVWVKWFNFAALIAVK